MAPRPRVAVASRDRYLCQYGAVSIILYDTVSSSVRVGSPLQSSSAQGHSHLPRGQDKIKGNARETRGPPATAVSLAAVPSRRVLVKRQAAINGRGKKSAKRWCTRGPLICELPLKLKKPVFVVSLYTVGCTQAPDCQKEIEGKPRYTVWGA